MAATATYEYQVRDKAGKLVKGKIDAESPAMVARRGFIAVAGLCEASAG